MVFHVEVDFSSFPIVAGLGQESGDQAQEGFFIGDDRTHLSGPLRVLVCELGMDTIAPQTPLGLHSPAGGGSHLIIFLPEIAHHPPCFRQRPQLFSVQAFISETSVKTLHKPVLPRTPRLNVDGFDAILLEPSLHDLGDELRTVVAS